MQDQIGYDEIIENSMRLVIYETLKKVEKAGLLGKHYFIITFLTRFAGVSIPQSLLEKYPDEMTIVIQYQFRGLVVEADSFKISLGFSGKYEKLEVPYKAVTSFADPSMNFALKFSMSYSDLQELELEDLDESNQVTNENGDKKSNTKIDLSAKVVSLDAFRKNKGVINPSDK
jgi:hypothetical protein